jgi:hypothetical protein
MTTEPDHDYDYDNEDLFWQWWFGAFVGYVFGAATVVLALVVLA